VRCCRGIIIIRPEIEFMSVDNITCTYYYFNHISTDPSFLNNTSLTHSSCRKNRSGKEERESLKQRKTTLPRRQRPKRLKSRQQERDVKNRLIFKPEYRKRKLDRLESIRLGLHSSLAENFHPPTFRLRSLWTTRRSSSGRVTREMRSTLGESSTRT